MRYALPALLFAVVALAAPAPAHACYSWQALTCPERNATILDKHRNVRGYIQPDGAILDKHRRIRGYIEGDGTVLGIDRSIRGYVQPSDSLTVEGLPSRYSPILD